jgi:nucleoside-diphosphate-sugar epimerase
MPLGQWQSRGVSTSTNELLIPIERLTEDPSLRPREGSIMRALVTGGAGFVGSHLCERLLAGGDEVICVDNFSTGRRQNIVGMREHRGFTYLVRDVTEPLPALPRLDQIYHLASPASPPAYQRYPIETLRVNGEGTRHLLDLAAAHGARFLYASTSEVYGDPLQHPQSEEYRGNVSTVGPRSMYDEAKRYGEALTIAYGETHGVETRIARIFNTYGPRMDPDDGRVVSNFIVQALRGGPLTVYGTGCQTRSFQYVDDLIEGMVRLMVSTYCGPVNIGNPSEYTIFQLAQLIRELTATAAPIEFLTLPEDDPKQRRPDITLAQTVLGWAPRVSVRAGLAATIPYFQEELSADPVGANGHYRSYSLPVHTNGRRDAIQPTVN